MSTNIMDIWKSNLKTWKLNILFIKNATYIEQTYTYTNFFISILFIVFVKIKQFYYIRKELLENICFSFFKIIIIMKSEKIINLLIKN